MHIPASRLAPALIPGIAYEVRNSDYSGFNRAMPYTEAVARAIKGELEGVATPGGRIKYLRILPESERESEDALDHAESLDTGHSTAFANLKMGAYREDVESAQMDEWGMPTRIVIGHIWQLHGVRL